MTGEDTPTNHHLVNVAGITIRKLTVALNIFRITLALIFARAKGLETTPWKHTVVKLI